MLNAGGTTTYKANLLNLSNLKRISELNNTFISNLNIWIYLDN